MPDIFELHSRSNQAQPQGRVTVMLGRRDIKTVSWKSDFQIQKIRYRRKNDSFEIYVDNGLKNFLGRTIHPRKESTQALVHARAAIARKALTDVGFSHLNFAARSSWPLVNRETAKYAEPIGDEER